jgi:hypothetical protein
MRLILHIGTHKTGTTTIQNILNTNRCQLASQGLHYPDCQPVFGRSAVNHYLFANSLANFDQDGLEKAKKFVDYIDSVGRDGSTIVLSAEQFYRHISGKDWWGGDLDGYWEHRCKYIETVAYHLRNFEVDILMCLREEKGFQESLYSELIKTKRFMGVKEVFLYEYAPMFDYENQINVINSVFGSLRIFSYEHALSKGLAATFFKQIGCEMPSGADQVWENKTS